MEKLILGKSHQIRLALACLLAEGHLLIEDVPGVGKTTLAHGLAKVLGLSFQRIQFTSDLLPADVTGVSIYDRDNKEFVFKPGPIFAQLLLADEINRATPKTQSSLLEAMEERQVTTDGQSHKLPEPFFVVATQNPSEQIGTFPLPESQLDRFLMRIEIGYPDAAAERELLTKGDTRKNIHSFTSGLNTDDLSMLRQAVNDIVVSEALIDYVQDIVQATREPELFQHGLSPRAALGLIRAAKSWAFLSGHKGVLPEDVQAVLPGVVDHRLITRHKERTGDSPSNYLQHNVAIP
ncbi:MAG: AAA family ATPase [Gammaproteobacteria bacterium]|nr:AAA family ATPase [Gammaproteobacteria bacterium]NNC96758.1 AAA family ATPase [Gammaproteobacteria bacterium]NNM13512.1 AAA family ATPase [Gammaproteobacteria bacterium]